ncbi:MAG: hypothetical protein ABI433_07155 [Burkholderiaceae bacterium]
MNAMLAWFGRWFVQPDKALHALVGMLFALGLAPLFSDLAVIGIVGLIAWGKERYDKAHADKHTPDGWDAFATVAGALLGLLVWRVLMHNW